MHDHYLAVTNILYNEFEIYTFKIIATSPTGQWMYSAVEYEFFLVLPRDGNQWNNLLSI